MGWRRVAFATVVGLLTATRVGSVQAEPYKSPLSAKDRQTGAVTFSRLVVRLSADEVGVEGDHLRVQFIETLRSLGYNARGAESLVFDRDDSAKARFVLGGTALELQCRPLSPMARRCWLGVTWELLDRQSDRVTYRAHARHMAEGTQPKELADQLIWGTYYSLLSRPKFLTALSSTSAPPTRVVHASAKYLRCSRPESPMPGSAEALMSATVLVEAGQKVGSGTLISPDGFVLTAAHVVENEARIRFQPRGGAKIPATVIRSDPHADVALLKATTGSDYPCVTVRRETVAAGEDLFAIGSPYGHELAFTLTRGVVSGARSIDGVSLVQTDASINRGNSGGPLLDSSGRLVGVVSWKIVESGVEGIAFGVSVQSALDGLGIEPADHSEAILSQASVAPAPAAPTNVDDAPDALPMLWPPPPPPAAPSPPRGPKSAPAKKLAWIGIITAGVGAVGVGATYAIYESEKYSLRQDGFDRLRLANDIAWIAVLGGSAAFGVSELLPRESPPAPLPARKRAARARPSLSIGVAPGAAVLRGTY